MKYLVFFLVIVIFINSVKAQNEKASYNFIRKVVTAQNDEKILYCDSISPYAIAEIKRALFDSGTSNKFVLTTNEKKYVRAELNKMRKYVWRDSLFQNSILIKKDSINYAFGKSNSANMDGWDYFKRHFGQGYYDFSKPIFIRNGTMCIFYRGENCGWLCGEGFVGVYVKKGKKWILKYELSSWVS